MKLLGRTKRKLKMSVSFDRSYAPNLKKSSKRLRLPDITTKKTFLCKHCKDLLTSFTFKVRPKPRDCRATMPRVKIKALLF